MSILNGTLTTTTIKNMLVPARRNDEPGDNFRILDSWAEYEEGNGKMYERTLKFMCYELELINSDTGEKHHVFKACKFARVIRLPKSAKQSTALMDMHEQVLSACYESEINLITVIANVIHPKPLGLFFLYGCQGVAENIEDAKRKCYEDYTGLTYALQGTYRVLEMRTINAQETEWLKDKLYNMNYMAVIRGIPKANKSAEDGGNKGFGGKNINPDSQGTLEEVIAGMADFEYVLQILTTPVKYNTLKAKSLKNERQMTDWYSQLQGNTSLSMNISMPMVYGANAGRSSGWSHNYTNSESVSYSQGENFSHSVGENVSQSLSQSFSESYGESTSHSVGTSHGTSINYGNSLSTSQGVNNSIGMSEGLSSSASAGHSTGSSFGTSSSHGTNSGMSMNHSDGTSSSTSANHSDGTSSSMNESTSLTQSHGTSQSQSYGTSNSTSHSTSQGYSEGTSHTRSEGMSHSQSISEGYSGSESSSHSAGTSSGTSYGTSYSSGESHSAGTGNGISLTDGSSGGMNASLFGVGGNASQSNSTSNSNSMSVSDGTSASNGASSSMSSSLTSSDSTSMSSGWNNSSSESYGTNVSESIGQTQTVSTSESNSVSQGFNQSQSMGVSNSMSMGSSTGYSQGVSSSDSYGVSQGTSTSDSIGYNMGNSDSIGQNFGTSYGANESYSMGSNLGHSMSSGESAGLSQGQTYSVGQTNSTSESYGTGTSHSVSQGTTQGESHGTSESTSQGSSYSTGNGTSTSEALGSSGSVNTGVSSSMGLGPSIGYSKSHQWLDQQVKDIIELLEFNNNRYKRALRSNGAFYTYVYFACSTKESLAAAITVSKAAWQNTDAMTHPLQALELSEGEQQHMLYRFSAFSSEPMKEDVYGMKDYKYCTMLLPDELTAYTHLPRISEGGVFSEVNDIPHFACPSGLKGELYLGKIINAERWTMANGYNTPYDYRVEESALMHGIITGASRSGKTVCAMRFIKELAHIKRKKTGKRLRIVCLDPKRDWRGLAKFIEPDRFRFYSLGNVNFHPIKLNPWKIPKGVVPQIWIDGIIDIYCRAYGLLERGKQMIADVVYELYDRAGVFEACDDENWKNIVPELSSAVCFEAIYKAMERKRDEIAASKKSGFDTLDAYSRLLDRLSTFGREFSIERRLFGTSEGMGIDEMIGDDDVTVLESKGLENTFKNFIFGAITSGFYKFALAHDKGYLSEDQYETVLVIEEANEVLTGSDNAGASNMGGGQSGMSGQSEFEQIVDQAAGYGLFIIAITQKISMMPSSLIANAGIKFIGRLGANQDIQTAAIAIGKEPRYEDRDVVKWFPRAPIGWFICQTSRGFDYKMAEPILVAVDKLDIPTPTNEDLEEILLEKHLAKLGYSLRD